MTQSITARGYGIEATLTATELVARGTSKPFHFALVGAEHEGDLVLPLERIERVNHTPPKMAGLVNGLVDVRTVDGKRYQMHYRKKNRGFRILGDALAGVVMS